MKPLKDRFEDKYIPEPNSGCWLWIGALNGNYGQIKCGGRREGNILAHRASYEIYKGPFNKNLDILHKCDNPSCVNPDHLFIGDHSDNMTDMSKKVRANPRGRKLKLIEKDLYDIRDSAEKGYDLAKKYQVSAATISMIKNGKYVGVSGIKRYLEVYNDR